MSDITLIIHGPAGCGKSTNGEHFRRFFNKKKAFDAEEVLQMQIERNALYLTTDSARAKELARRLPYVRELSFSEAMTAAGLTQGDAGHE